MTSKNFTPGTVIDSPWLNDVNAVTYERLRSGQLAGLRNKVINGNFAIDQRYEGASSGILGTQTYKMDRWFATSSAAPSGSITAQRVAGDDNSQYAARIAKTSGTLSSYLTLGQVIETRDVYPLVNNVITLSFRYRVGSSYTGSDTPYISVVSGTGVDEGASSGAAGTWTGFQALSAINYSIPTANISFRQVFASYTVPSNVREILVVVGMLTSSNAGSANDYMEITDVQLEVGVSPTVFETRFHPIELILCQRFYEKSFNAGVIPGTISLPGALATRRTVTGETTTVFQDRFKVTKRTAPTITWYNPQNGSSGQIYNVSSGAISVTGISASIQTSTANVGAPTHIAGGSAGEIILGHFVASSEL